MRRALASFVGPLFLVFLAGCSSTGIGASDAAAPDAAIVVDAAPALDAEPALDAGADAGSAGRCFADVELARLSGGRESFAPAGLFAYEGGWIALYEATSHGDGFERAAAFLDRGGRVAARQALGRDEVVGARAVLGRFLFASDYGLTQLYEIGEGALIDRTELLGGLPPATIEVVERDGDRLRILSATWVDTAAGTFRFAYSEIVLGADGTPIVRTAELPAAETLGAPGLVAGLSRYGGVHAFAMHEDTLLFAFPTGERVGDVGGDAWNVTRVALDRSGLESGAASWSVIDETRWEAGPVDVFGAVPELGIAIAGRYRADGAGGFEGTISGERFADPTAEPIVVSPAGDFGPGQLGPATVERRDGAIAIATPRRARVLSIPALDERAAATLDLRVAITAWGDEFVLELGSEPTADGLRGLVRCHALSAAP